MDSKSHVSLRRKARESLGAVLQHVWEAECLLSAKTRDYYRSVTGPHFHSLHRLFDDQRRQLDQWLELLGQRTVAAGVAVGRGMAGATRTTSAAVAGVGVPAGQMIGDLLRQHEQLASKLREDLARLSDPAAADLLARLADFHDTTAWMLRMVVSGSGPAVP